LDNDRWYSTQTTAYALLAIGKFGGSEQRKNSFDYTLNGASANVNADTYLYRIDVDMGKANNTLRIQNKAANKLYVRVIREGQLPVSENPPARNNPALLTMNVQYTNQQGEPIDPVALPQGTDFVA